MPRKLTVSDAIALEYMVQKKKAFAIPEICSGINMPFDKCCKTLDRLIAHKLVFITDTKKYKAY